MDARARGDGGAPKVSPFTAPAHSLFPPLQTLAELEMENPAASEDAVCAALGAAIRASAARGDLVALLDRAGEPAVSVHIRAAPAGRGVAPGTQAAEAGPGAPGARLDAIGRAGRQLVVTDPIGSYRIGAV